MSEAAASGVECEDQLIGAICSDIDAYYTARVVRYGATPHGVDWSCQATQALRFVQLLKVCDFSVPFALNDVGCGYGALVPFLAARHAGCEIDYLGVDLSRTMISRARHRFSGPKRHFVVATGSPRIADYSVASGIMNVNVGYSRASWEDYVETVLQRMLATSRYGFSVNFMLPTRDGDVDVDSRAPRLYRTTPEIWTAYCERELQANVEVVGNYGMKEFTLLVRRAADATLPLPSH